MLGVRDATSAVDALKTIGEVVWVATGFAKVPVNDNVNVPPVVPATVTVSISFGLRATGGIPRPYCGECLQSRLDRGRA